MGISNSTDRFNGVVASLAIKVRCVLAATSNVASLIGIQTIEGVAVAENDRVLLTAQTDPIENGVYDVQTTAWTRAFDWDGNRDVELGSTIWAGRSAGSDVLYQVTAPAGNILPGNTAVTITVLFDPENTAAADLQAVTDTGFITTNEMHLDGGALLFTEQVSAPVASVATIGQLWVRNDVPNRLIFTDDLGNDMILGHLVGSVIDATLRWDGSANYVENENFLVEASGRVTMQNAQAIRWDDIADAPVDMLIFDPVSGPGPVLTDEYLQDDTGTIETSSSSYIDVDAVNRIFDVSAMTDGDDYFLYSWTGFANHVSSSPTENFIRLNDGGELPGSEGRIDEFSNVGWPWQYGYRKSSVVSAGADVTLQFKNTDLFNVRSIDWTAFGLNVSNFAAGDFFYSEDLTNTAAATYPSYTNSAAAVTVGPGSWLIFVNGYYASAVVAQYVGLNDGSTIIDLSVENGTDGTNKKAMGGIFIAESLTGSTTFTVAAAASASLNMTRAMICAIRIEGFKEFYVDVDLVQNTSISAGLNTLLTRNFTAVNSGEFLAIGFNTDRWPSTGVSGEPRIEVEINSGGANIVSFASEKQVGDSDLPYTFPVLPIARFTLTAGDDVDVEFILDSAGTGSSEIIERVGMVVFSLATSDVTIETFLAGDPAFVTQIDGSLIFLNSDLVSGDGADDVRFALGTGIKIEEKAAANASAAGDGQFWVRNDAPNLPMFTDDAGDDFILNASGGVSTDTFNYQFDDDLSLADPGAGFISFNNASFSLVTAMAINIVDGDGVDIDPDIDRLVRGSAITFRDPADPTKFAVFSINGNKTDLNPYWIIGINPLYTGTEFTDQQDINVRLDLDLLINMAKPGSVTGAIPIWDQDEGQLIMPDGAFRLTFDAQTSGQSILHSNNNLLLRSSFNLEMEQPLFMEERAASGTPLATWGQLWVRDDIPTNLMYTDDAGNDFVLAGGFAAGFVIDQHNYIFANTFTMTDPGSQFFRINNTDAALATEMVVSDLRKDSLDIGANILANVQVGDVIRFVRQEDLSVFVTYTVTTVSDDTTFFTFGLNHESGPTRPGNNDTVTLEFDPQEIGAVSLSGTQTNANIGVFDGSNSLGGDTFFTWNSATLAANANANVGSRIDLGEDSTLRGDNQIASIRMWGEDSGVIYGAEISVGEDDSALTIEGTVVGGSTDIDRVLLLGPTLAILELSSAPSDVATQGQIWVRDDAPNTLMFTDDVGTDFVVGGALAPALPVGTDEQTLVNVSGVWTASDFFKHDDSDIITLTNQFAQVFTVDLSSSGLWRFGGAGLNSMDFGDTVLNVGSSGTGAVFEINYAATIMSLATNTAAHRLRLGNTGTPWTAVEIMQGTILRFLEAGGIEPMDMNNDGSYILMSFNSNTRGLKLDNSASIYLEERAAANTDETNYGQLWVRDDQTPMFTTEAGVDSVLNAAAGGSPFATPLTITGDINTATPPASEAITGLLVFTDLAGDDDIASMGFTGNNDFIIENFMRGGNLDLVGTNGSGVTKNVLTSIPGTAVVLWGPSNPALTTQTNGVNVAGSTYVLESSVARTDKSQYGQFWARNDTIHTPMFTADSGEDFELGNPFSTPLTILADINTATPPALEGVTARLQLRDLANDDALGLFGFSGANVLNMRNLMRGGLYIMTARTTAGVDATILNGDPDELTILRAGTDLRLEVEGGTLAMLAVGGGAFTLHHDGNPVLQSIGTGAQVRSGTDDNPTFQWLQDDGTRNFFISAILASGVTMGSEIEGGNVNITGEDSGGTTRNILVADPDAVTILRGDTDLDLQVTAGETAIYCTANQGVEIYWNDQVNFRITDESLADIHMGAEVRHYDDSFYPVGMNVLPPVNALDSGNDVLHRDNAGKMLTYNTGTARTLNINNDGSLKVGTMWGLMVGPSAGTLTGDGGTGVVIRWWNGSGWTTTASGGNITIGVGQYSIWKETDTLYFISGPTLS